MNGMELCRPFYDNTVNDYADTDSTKDTNQGRNPYIHAGGLQKRCGDKGAEHGYSTLGKVKGTGCPKDKDYAHGGKG